MQQQHAQKLAQQQQQQQAQQKMAQQQQIASQQAHQEKLAQQKQMQQQQQMQHQQQMQQHKQMHQHQQMQQQLVEPQQIQWQQQNHQQTHQQFQQQQSHQQQSHQSQQQPNDKPLQPLQTHLMHNSYAAASSPDVIVAPPSSVTQQVPARLQSHAQQLPGRNVPPPPPAGRTPMPTSRKGLHMHQATTGQMKSLIISDSTCSRIRKNEIDACIDVRQEIVEINKFPNAEAEAINHYSIYPLEKNCPDNVIIVAGLNDLLHHDDRENADCKAIANKVMNIGKMAKEKGVARVCISGLVKPRYYNCLSSTDKINMFLRDMCVREGFIYIDQSNIEPNDLGDGIHVGNNGLKKLKSNIFKELYTNTYSSS